MPGPSRWSSTVSACLAVSTQILHAEVPEHVRAYHAREIKLPNAEVSAVAPPHGPVADTGEASSPDQFLEEIAGEGNGAWHRFGVAPFWR